MIYLDTSAFLKTVLVEPQSAALQAYLDERPGALLVSSSLLAIEARRGVLRHRPDHLPRVDVLLATVEQIALSDAVVENASRLPDPLLRSPDAIHLSTALLLHEEVDVLLTYDDRLATAAKSHGLTTAAPA